MVKSENPIGNICPQSTLPGPNMIARMSGKCNFPMGLGRRNEISEHLANFSFGIMMVSPFHVMWGERGKVEGTERGESVCQKCSPLACGSNWMLSVMKREEVFVSSSWEEGTELFFPRVERRSKCLLCINPCLCLSSDPMSIFFTFWAIGVSHTDILSLPNGVLKAVRM